MKFNAFLSYGSCQNPNFSNVAEVGFKQNRVLSSFDNHNAVKQDYDVSDNDDGGDDGITVMSKFERVKAPRREIKKVEIEEDEFRHPLVREVSRLIQQQSTWSPTLEGELRNLLRSLKPRHVCAVLCSQSDERVALKFFYWADRQWRYRHDPMVYHIMLEVLSKTKLCEGARRVLRLMRRRGIRCRSEAFSCVMVSYSRAGDLKSAMKVLSIMHKAGVEPDLLICNTAVHVLVMGNKMEKALWFVERMKLIGIDPNVVTYNCLIKGYCELDRLEDAMKLISEIPSPDKVSYYTVMGFLCKEKRVKEVKDLMLKMEENKLLIDQVTYITLIHMLSKHGHGHEALEFLREAEERGFHIDKVGYSAVISSMCKEGKMDEANELVNAMLLKGCMPDVVTYTTLVDGYCLAGKVDKAKEVMQQMYKNGCKPNTVSYTALLNGLCRNGNSLEAREMMNMSEEEWWTPNAITYSVVMHGLRREGKLSDACDVAKEMIQKGYFPSSVEINLIIQGLCREGKIDHAKKFMQECLSTGCSVNEVNFTTVIHGYCRAGNLEASLSLLDDMYLCNKHPDNITYTIMINALGKNGRMEEATKLIMKMLDKNLYPTPEIYRIAIHWYCRVGKVEALSILLEKMLLKVKSRTIYNQVIEKLCNFGHLDEAYKLLGKVLRTASRVDANTCHVLMENYLKKGNPVLAYTVACRMFKRNLIPDFKLCEKVSKRLMAEGKEKEADELILRFVERGRISPQCRENLRASLG
ncbi:hypothetical protein ACFE04_030941 [Oxalis oulophora]